MKLFIVTMVSLLILPSDKREIDMEIDHSFSVDSLGACQGIFYRQDTIFLYGDREVGVIREFHLNNDSLTDLHKEVKLTVDKKDVINHPTGIAYHAGDPAFIGNSIRLNPEGTLWKAVIYCINWDGLLKTGTLDGNIINAIEDDACIQGTRPEYVSFNNKWYVATADYGGKDNEVRLYDPQLLRKAKKTSEKGVLVKKFSCSPWIQNLHWIADKGILVLIQNQVEGRKWRFTFVDLKTSIESGHQKVIKVVDIDRSDELEGFSFLTGSVKGVAVTSSRSHNVNVMKISW